MFPEDGSSEGRLSSGKCLEGGKESTLPVDRPALTQGGQGLIRPVLKRYAWEIWLTETLMPTDV